MVFFFFPDVYPGVELLDHMATLFFVFQGISVLLSIVAAPIYISANSVGGFNQGVFLKSMFSVVFVSHLSFCV